MINVDEQGTIQRFKTLTMDQAGVGSEGPDELVLEYFGHVSLRDAGDVDNVARLAASARPFGPEWQVDYRFCAEANDERIESLVFLLRQENDPGQRSFLEVSLRELARFEGGSIDAAVVFAARIAAESMQRAD